jgi:hypothetical protein
LLTFGANRAKSIRMNRQGRTCRLRVAGVSDAVLNSYALNKIGVVQGSVT